MNSQELSDAYRFIDRLRSALNTEECGESLIAVAKAAHAAELELAQLVKSAEELTPTEKHRSLAEQLLKIGGGCDGADDYPRDVTRIANMLTQSESEATAQLRADYESLRLAFVASINDALKLRDALAQVDRHLTGTLDYEHACMTEVTDDNAVTPAKIVRAALAVNAPTAGAK